MIPFQALVAFEHLAELQREAAERRRAREVDFAGGEPNHPGPSEVRRALARLAVGLSHAAAETARRLDPAFDEAAGSRRTSEAA
jgi:aspartate/methionine/tyrosine aminotransferase